MVEEIKRGMSLRCQKNVTIHLGTLEPPLEVKRGLGE
jgi:hypothetical protein